MAEEKKVDVCVEEEEEECPEEVWNGMYLAMETHLMENVEKKKRKKESEKLKKAWKRLEVKKRRSFNKLSEDFSKKEVQLVKKYAELERMERENGWKERKKIREQKSEVEEDRRHARVLGMVAASLAKFREKSQIKKEEVKGGSETPQTPRGLYPALPGEVSFPPPPYHNPSCSIQAPLITVAGRLGCHVEGVDPPLDTRTKDLVQTAFNRIRQNIEEGNTATPTGERHEMQRQVSVLTGFDGGHPHNYEGEEASAMELAQLDQQGPGYNTRQQVRARAEQQEFYDDLIKLGRDLDEHTRLDRNAVVSASRNTPTPPPHSTPALYTSAERRAHYVSPSTLRQGPIRDPNNPYENAATHKTMFPLIPLGNNEVGYVPLALKDVQTASEKLPRLSGGGGKWISKFLQVFQGMEIAMGDVRAVLGLTATAAECTLVETRANTVREPNSIPFRNVSDVFFATLRQLFPTPLAAAPAVFTYDGQDLEAYYSACESTWTDCTGRCPEANHTDRVMFRSALIKGLPNEVKTLLEDDPDAMSKDGDVFKRHLLHHLKKYKDRRNEADEETSNLKMRLLKLQLKEAEKSVNESKKQAKANDKEPAPDREMLLLKALGVNKAQPEQPVPQMPVFPATALISGLAPTIMAPMNPYMQSGGQWRGGRGRGGGRGRPQVQRGRSPRPVPSQGCFVCGDPYHWARECPHAQPPAMPQRGRGRGGVDGRGPPRGPPPPQGGNGYVPWGEEYDGNY